MTLLCNMSVIYLQTSIKKRVLHVAPQSHLYSAQTVAMNFFFDASMFWLGRFGLFGSHKLKAVAENTKSYAVSVVWGAADSKEPTLADWLYD